MKTVAFLGGAAVEIELTIVLNSLSNLHIEDPQPKLLHNISHEVSNIFLVKAIQSHSFSW